MANPTTHKKRKSGSNAADFKRVKAKVGKRATRQVNETDTTFKTSAVRVSQQNVPTNIVDNDKKKEDSTFELQELYSTRGRSLDDLASHLKHPAAPVRISAAKGLLDCLSRKDISNLVALLQSNLPLIIPMCAKCWVDDDQEVRQLGVACIRQVVMTIHASYLQPFLPLIMTHVISCLHSLDRPTQVDGTQLVELLANQLPSQFLANYRAKIVPAYVTLLTSSSSSNSTATSNQYGSTTSKKKQKAAGGNKAKTKTDPTQQAILQSLYALLKSGKGDSTKRQAVLANSTPDLVVVPHGRGVNALFVPGPTPSPQPTPLLIPLKSLDDLATYVRNDIASTTNRRNAHHQQPSIEPISIPIPIAAQLLGKLRDVLVEATQDQNQQQQQQLGNEQQVLLILEATHLFYISIRHLFSIDESSHIPQQSGVDKIWSQYCTLIMNLFADSRNNSSSQSSTTTILVNLEIGNTILDAHLDGTGNITPQQLESVLRFVWELLKHTANNSIGGDGDIAAVSDKSNDNHVWNAPLFGALERIFITSTQEGIAMDNDNGASSHESKLVRRSIHRKLIQTIAFNFFPKEVVDMAQQQSSQKKASFSQTDAITRLACSPGTRKCVRLVGKIFAHRQYLLVSSENGANKNTTKDLSSRLTPLLYQIVQGLSVYLSIWEGNYTFETSLVLALLHEVARRIDVASIADAGDESENQSSPDRPLESSLVKNLRASLVAMVKYNKKRQDANGKTVGGSILELLPEELHRKFIALVVVLQAPVEDMLNGLSRICARCWGANQKEKGGGAAKTVSPAIASLIVQSIHTIRRTISMQAFLGFVTSSMGVTHFSFANKQPDDTFAADSITGRDIMKFDQGIDLACHILSQCGPAKVLPMLDPLLRKWMSLEDSSDTKLAEWILTARTGILLLATSSLVMQDTGLSVLEDVLPTVKELTAKATCCLLENLPILNEEGANDMPYQFLEPVITLFAHDNDLYQNVYKRLSSNISSITSSQQTRMIEALLVISSDSKLLPSINSSSSFLNHAKVMEEALVSTSAERVGGRLRALMEVNLTSNTMED